MLLIMNNKKQMQPFKCVQSASKFFQMPIPLQSKCNSSQLDIFLAKRYPNHLQVFKRKKLGKSKGPKKGEKEKKRKKKNRHIFFQFSTDFLQIQ